MSKILRNLSQQFCSHIPNTTSESVDISGLVRRIGTPSTIPLMYHIVGFDGKDFRKLDKLSDEVFNRYTFLIFRPFYHSISGELYINSVQGWKWFANIKKHAVAFANPWKAHAYAAEPRASEWTNLLINSGITSLNVPLSQGLPTIRETLNQFAHIQKFEKHHLAHVVLNLFDGMTRSTSVDIFINAFKAVLNLDASEVGEGVWVRSKIDGASLNIEISEEKDQKYRKVSRKGSLPAMPAKLNELRDRVMRSSNIALAHDVYMLRAIYNSLVVVPMAMYSVASMEHKVTDDAIHLNVLMKPVLPEDPMIRINASIKTN